MGGFVVALVGFGYSVYLTYLELFKIDAICQWCVVSAVLMTVLFVVNAVRMVALRRETERGGSRARARATSERRRSALPASWPAPPSSWRSSPSRPDRRQREQEQRRRREQPRGRRRSRTERWPGSRRTAWCSATRGAKVTLIEFGDLKCPVCKAFSEEIMPPVIESKVASGEARIEFRNFTIIGEQSGPAGAAALAAGEQGRGWNFLELFYRNQGVETLRLRGRRVPHRGRQGGRRRGHRRAGTANARARGSAARSKRRPQKPKQLGFTGTPSFAVEGPDGELEPLGTPGSAGELEAAIDSARSLTITASDGQGRLKPCRQVHITTIIVR